MSLDQAAGSAAVMHCPSCGAEVALNLLSCPSCRRLVHADRLRELAEAAESAERRGDPTAALTAWNQALPLLPPGTRQASVIADRIAALGRMVETSPRMPSATGIPADPEQHGQSAEGPSASGWSKGAASGVLGTLLLAVWKFKFLAFALLGKAKLLLLGLTKASTFLSMFAMVGVYWTQFGLWFALGLVVSIYVHEMGHVAALTRYGVPASAPLFIPGLGAVIRLKQDFTDPRQDARVGLAGPIWGLGAAIFCAVLFLLTEHKLWAALAQFGALINLFNLMPIWQLDGGRAFRSLNRPQRWLAAASLATVWAVTEDGLALLIMIVAAARALLDRPNDRPDRPSLVWYVGLVAALSFLAYSPYLRIR
ncbi:MAG: site-2 protease family protein [Isosphaeraceae bacterium]